MIETYACLKTSIKKNEAERQTFIKNKNGAVAEWSKAGFERENN